MNKARKLLALVESIDFYGSSSKGWKAWLDLGTGKANKFPMSDDHRDHDPRGKSKGKILSYTEMLKDGYARISYDGRFANVHTYGTNDKIVRQVKTYLLSQLADNTKVIWDVDPGSRTTQYPMLKTMGARFQSRTAAFR